jgi:hypothetical protein
MEKDYWCRRIDDSHSLLPFIYGIINLSHAMIALSDIFYRKIIRGKGNEEKERMG